jgi:UDP-glucose 4-epimerase
MLRQAREKGVIELYGDGSQRRTFTHVADLCTIMTQASLLPHTQGRTFNIGSYDHLSLKELAELVAQKTGADIAFKPWPELDKAIESGDTMFDDSLLQSQFPYGYAGSITEYLATL